MRVLKTVSEHAGTMTASSGAAFFSVAGSRIVEQFYKKKCQPVAGSAWYKFDDVHPAVPMHGRHDTAREDGADRAALHCWAVCEGWVIDFTAPLFREAEAASGYSGAIPRRMFQKPVDAMADSPLLMSAPGDFYMLPDVARTRAMLDAMHADEGSTDLQQVCLQWFRRPPKDMPRRIEVAGGGETTAMILSDLVLAGAW